MRHTLSACPNRENLPRAFFFFLAYGETVKACLLLPAFPCGYCLPYAKIKIKELLSSAFLSLGGSYLFQYARANMQKSLFCPRNTPSRPKGEKLIFFLYGGSLFFLSCFSSVRCALMQKQAAFKCSYNLLKLPTDAARSSSAIIRGQIASVRIMQDNTNSIFRDIQHKERKCITL